MNFFIICLRDRVNYFLPFLPFLFFFPFAGFANTFFMLSNKDIYTTSFQYNNIYSKFISDLVKSLFLTELLLSPVIVVVSS